MPQYLNQDLGFDEVRWATTRKTSYDALGAFDGPPLKVLLHPGTRLVRLVAMAAGNVFDGVWWMPQEVFTELRADVNSASHGSGRLLRNYIAQSMALPSGSYQLSAVEIELTQPVYGWTGKTKPLFSRPGGMDQVFLPNLGERGNRGTSLFAKQVFTYWLKF